MADDLEVLCEREKQSRGRAIAAGAVNYLKRWPMVGPIRGDFFNAVLAGCLVTAGFIILALVPAILAFAPSRPNGTCRLLRTSFGSETENSTNIYFAKHENRTWTNDELCHIETAARHYPDYNIFMINIYDKAGPENDYEFCESLDNYILSKVNNKIIEKESTNSMNRQVTSRIELESKSLEMNIQNIIKVDVAMEKLFAGSMVSKNIRKFNTDQIELAAKFQIIWDLPGIAIEPSNFHDLKNIIHYFEQNKVDAAASIGIDNDLQATSVSCQSFIGLVIREMAKSNFTDRQTLLERVFQEYCPSMVNCDGVRIIRSSTTRSSDFTTCPVVSFEIKTNDNLDEDFVNKSMDD